VVGVVADIQTKVAFGNFGPIGAAPAAYVPAAQVSSEFFTMVHTWFSPSWFLRASGPQSGIAAGIERALQSVDPLLPLAKLRTLQEVRGEAMATERAQTLLLTAFAVLALSLAAVGLYALVASAVEERRRELGIRLALGATAGQAVRVAAAPGFALAVVGVVVGLVAARLVARAMEHVVWGVSVGDSFTFAVAGALVFTVACVATLVPAMRIVRLNPIQTLRQS
jgi:ABC-type lipoprotein release transport system permease subunit